MNVMIFDIETVPDIDAGRRLYGLGDLSDADIAEAMYQLRRVKTGTDFLPHHLHQIVAISVVFRHQDTLRVWSLGDVNSSEAELISRFFDGLERYKPILASWNGSGFDLPVLHYRALLHEISAPGYWEIGRNDPSFRYNNYLGRFHWRHIDLMDVLAAYQPRAHAPLNEVAALLGFPGKQGMDGSQVWASYQTGDTAGIRNYCETDVLNTYLIYLRFELMRGNLSHAIHAQEVARLQAMLASQEDQHLLDFLAAWKAS